MFDEDQLRKIDRNIKIWAYIEVLMQVLSPEIYQAYRKEVEDDINKLQQALAAFVEDTSDNQIKEVTVCLNFILTIAFNTIQSIFILEINTFFSKYSRDVIQKVFPEYYSQYVTEADKIQENIIPVEERTALTSLYPQIGNSFEEMLEGVRYLRKVHKKISSNTFTSEIERLKQEEIMKRNRDQEAFHKLERLLAYGFGVVFLIAILVLAVYFPDPTKFQYTVFRIVISLAAAGAVSMIPGFFEFKLSTWLRASGALGVFAFVYLKNPAELVVEESIKSKTNTEMQTDSIATDIKSVKSK